MDLADRAKTQRLTVKRTIEPDGSMSREVGRQPETKPPRAALETPLANVMDDVVCVRADTPWSELQRAYRELPLHATPVVGSDGKLAGIVSSTDLARDGTTSGAVRDHMTVHVSALEETDTVGAALELMARRSVRHAPVVRNGDVVGMVSALDLIRFLVRQPRVVSA